MYPDALTVRVARDTYFATNGFSEAAYDDRWARVKIGPLPVVFPNTASRKRALPMHDLHHVVTGFSTTLLGEAEIGAWEVAGGCGRNVAAWLLNAGAFAHGLVRAPRRIYRAFVRGRHARNLYATGYSDALLELTVGQLRRQIEGAPARSTWRDRVAFAGWAALLAAPGIAIATVLRPFVR